MQHHDGGGIVVLQAHLAPEQTAGMSHKTTVYFPDDLKRALAREAARRGCSEAQVIREAVAQSISRPRPTSGLFDGESLSGRVDELLRGFGDR